MTDNTDISVLIADDQAEMRLLVRATLDLAGGFQVLPSEATNGAEAVDLASSHAPRAVVLDLSMPVMDGLSAITGILDRSPDSRIVVFSANDDPEVSAIALRRGAQAFVSKIRYAELPERLRGVCV